MTEFPAFNVMSSNVVTSVDAAYNNLSVDTYQLGDGVPQFEFRCLAYSDFEILLNKESHASVNDFRVTDGTTMIGFLGANTPSARWCGIEISPDTLFICPSGRDYLAAVPAGYCGICIQISNDLLSEEEILPDAFMTPGEVSSRWVLPIGQKGTEFCLWLLSILNRNSKVLELTCDPMAAALFRDRFLLALGNVLTLALNDDSIPTSARQYCRYGLARRANDIVSNSLRETISSEEVARELGVSRQILWLAFRDVMNISPHQYILKRKLQEVRRDLINTTTSQENVSDIAAKYGFQDFSRFGQFYRRMYGELPSKTLSSAKP